VCSRVRLYERTARFSKERVGFAGVVGTVVQLPMSATGVALRSQPPSAGSRSRGQCNGQQASDTAERRNAMAISQLDMERDAGARSQRGSKRRILILSTLCHSSAPFATFFVPLDGRSDETKRSLQFSHAK